MILIIFASCSLTKKNICIEANVLKAIWEGDPCGVIGRRQGIAYILVDSWEKKRIKMDELNYILGKPDYTNSFGKDTLLHCYYVKSFKGCEKEPYNDAATIGLAIYFNPSTKKIYSCQTNLY